MTIKTKREIGDKVFVLHKEQIKHSEIKSITISIGTIHVPHDNNRITETYWLFDEKGYMANFQENKVFTTREELIKSLI